MKRILIGVLFLVVLGTLSSCVIAGTATVIFSNRTTSYSLKFTLDGAAASPYPIAAGKMTQWAAISPGDHTLAATACDSGGNAITSVTVLSETINLPADLITTWTVNQDSSSGQLY